MQTRNLRTRNDWAALATMALCSCFGAAIAAPEGVRPRDGGLTRLDCHFFAEVSLPPGAAGWHGTTHRPPRPRYLLPISWGRPRTTPWSAAGVSFTAALDATDRH
jgi:hypothetical protein